jgi:membrane protein DedA with SNARE-associated domain
MGGDWIEQYGYWAVLLGGILEGETVFVAAGYGLSQEYLRPLPTFLAAVAGGTLGDVAYYALGRVYGARLIRAVPFLRRLRARAVLLLRRWGRATAFVARFAYGLRIVLPLSIGAARLAWPVFLLFNLLGSVAFAATYLTLGYLFGETLEEVLGRVRGHEGWILLGVLAAGAVFWGVREWKLLCGGEPGEPELGG